MTQITIGDKTAMVWREQAKRRGEVFAFVAVSSLRREEYPFAIAVATLGEAGYGFPTIPMLDSTYEGASALADDLNVIMGLSQKASIAIIADTMSRSNYKRDEAEGLTTVKLTQLEIRKLLGVIPDTLGDLGDEIADKLESALE